MSLLLTQAWEILPEMESEYEKFIKLEFIPKCTELGLVSVGGFYVEAGMGPRIIALKRADSLEQLAHLLSTSEFKDLVHDLKKYIFGYRTKILQPTGRTKDKVYEIQRGVWKYNMYYDILPGRRRQYAEFIINKYLPALESLDYVEVTGGWNVLIGGFSEIIGELTFKDPVEITMLLQNDIFRKLTHEMRRDYVTNFSSRIIRTTERFEEPKWFVL